MVFAAASSDTGFSSAAGGNVAVSLISSPSPIWITPRIGTCDSCRTELLKATMKLQKETKTLADHGKWYQDACGTAFAMELVGERWSMLIIRELMLGGRRFSDLRGSLPGISAKVLTERLTGLEQAGVLVKSKLPPPAATQVYELTAWGYLAEPAIQELGRWAARSPEHDPTLPLSPVGFMLSLRTMVDNEAANSLSGTIGLETGGESFVGHLVGGELPI